MKITLADWTKYLNFVTNGLDCPKGGEVHRMMSSQTGEGKADKGAELVPPAERVRAHTGRPEQ